MSLFTLALAAEFAEHGIAVNSLWPRTVIATAAVLYELGGVEMMSGARKPEIVADAAHAILSLPARQWTGRFFLDDEVRGERLRQVRRKAERAADRRPLCRGAAGNEGFWVRRPMSQEITVSRIRFPASIGGSALEATSEE
jgi:NAD(P)-dependent dehydrogenase (short-subunit alcohol dehydrogenase family)